MGCELGRGKMKRNNENDRHVEWFGTHRFIYGNVQCTVRLERDESGEVEVIACFESVGKRVGFVYEEFADVSLALKRACTILLNVRSVLPQPKKKAEAVPRLDPILERMGR